jgi:hypothetical protein
MGKKEVIEHIESQNPRSKEQFVAADDLDTTPECAYCEAEMPYVDFNEHSPSADYVIHVVPGEDEYTEPDKVLYCSTRCLVKQRESLISE